MSRVDHSAADVERRADDALGAEPLEPEHDANDVDDRIEGADFVEVDTVDGHLVNRPRLRPGAGRGASPGRDPRSTAQTGRSAP